MTEIQDSVLAAEAIVIIRSTPCDWVDTPQWHAARIGSEQQQPSHGNRATGDFPIGGRSLQIAWYLVETTDAVYRFHASGEELSAEVRQQLRGILESFRTGST
jgi:hypothetical protein